MDAAVERGLARWPDVPAVHGWLSLDRRGNWLLKNAASGRLERIGNEALNAYIARNYEVDSRGCWYFQNGPQRVYVSLAYTPLVARIDGAGFSDHCGRPLERGAQEYLDDEGSVLIAAGRGVALLDDRDLVDYAARAGSALESLPVIARRDVSSRFGFTPDPGTLEGPRQASAILDARAKTPL